MLSTNDQRIELTRCRIERVYRRVIPLAAISRLSTTVESKCAKVVAGEGSVKSSAGTYTAWIDVIEPVLVEVIRSCKTPISSASVGWYPQLTAYDPKGRHSVPECVAVDVIDKQQNVTTFVTELFRHRQTRQCNAQTVAGWLVHLTVNHRYFRLVQIFDVYYL